MNTLLKKRFQFYLFVSALWVSLWIFNAALSHAETFFPRTANEFWRILFLLPVHFLFFEYGVPFIVRKHSSLLLNILAGILLVSLQLILLSFGVYAWKQLGIELQIYTSFRHVTLDPDTLYHRTMEDVLYQFQGGITSLFFFGICKLFYDNFRLKQAAQQLRLEKQEAELNYLKSQTNPHFLFNTLNNIYSLARDKSDLTADAILRLSKILRFMLYETDREFIRIEEEVEIISNYIALEKIRYDDTLRVTFIQDIEDAQQPIPPLLIIPLIENAFKHGVANTRDAPSINIVVSVKQQQFTATVKNSTGSVQDREDIRENIGLSNLRRQLELLYKEYSLTVQQHATDFVAVLKINLASHV